MTDQPLVSIVVPVYNTEKYLSDCLESLLAQTEKTLKFWPSTTVRQTAVRPSCAGMLPIVRRYGFYAKNAGPGAARNTALKTPAANISCFAIPTICLSPQYAAKWLR